ncbi:MAG: hypothetical protein JXA30_22590 [Deltaproteobacteria bacterium]|nr:hypothetical protein [Deltaproteobacteria bacterium]
MGLFTSQIDSVQSFVAQHKKSGRLRMLKSNPLVVWPSESSLVLEEETGLELGNPKNGSLYYLLIESERRDVDAGVFLLGPDLGEIETASAPFAQVITASGDFADEYLCYRILRDALYDTKPKGVMTRFMPSRGTIWCRIAREALARDLSLADLGSAISSNLNNIPGVESVQVLFVTSCRSQISPLEKPGEETRRIVGAMVKMNEEMSYDCSGCEYRDVCDTVIELRKYRRELKEKQP